MLDNINQGEPVNTPMAGDGRGWLGPQCLVSLRSSGKVKKQEGNCVVLRTEEKTGNKVLNLVRSL